VHDIAAQFKEFARTAPGGRRWAVARVRPARDRGRRGDGSRGKWRRPAGRRLPAL